MVSDTDILGVSGLIRLSGETRLVGFLDIKKVSPSLGLMAYFAIKRWLIQHNENDVYITCDGQFAERFLAALRFVPTDEMRADYRNGEMKRVWRWHPY